MRKHLVLFVQPEMSRHFDFMKLYERGLITDWVRDTAAGEGQLSAFVDIVVIDLVTGIEESLNFCTEAKRRRGDRVVVLLHDKSVPVPQNECIDLVLPRSVAQDDFVREVQTLLEARRERAAS
jgi:hypothetical protein